MSGTNGQGSVLALLVPVIPTEHIDLLRHIRFISEYTVSVLETGNIGSHSGRIVVSRLGATVLCVIGVY